MRFSLRTLLAFEDNVFDVEQHRRLEQLLPSDKNAEATLRRIRSIVRNPALGVPGLIDHQEELDPNYVAEYLDHQMSGSVQEKFETYCISADKYLAEIASIHHILSNVLGEPARTSRECRLRCYNVPYADKEPSATPFSEVLAHFHPNGAPKESKTDKPRKSRYFAPLWNLLFPVKAASVTPVVPPAVPPEKRSPFWIFTLLGLFICALLLGWQQIEKKRLAQQHEGVETATIAGDVENLSASPVSPNSPAPPAPEIFENYLTDHAVAAFATEQDMIEVDHVDQSDKIPAPAEQQSDLVESPAPLAPLDVIEQVAFASETFPPFTSESVANTSATTANVLPVELPRLETINPEDTSSTSKESEDGAIVAFQSIGSPTMPATESANRSNAQPLSRGSGSAWQPVDKEGNSALPQPASITVQQPFAGSLPMSSSAPTAAKPPKVVGRAIDALPTGLIFSAMSSGAPWQLPSLPFDLSSDQYLLTVAPFRGTFELTASFRIEMIGDAKICILPLDASGIPGIFVDYGRIIIHPLKPNRSLRIETERSRGTVSSTGTESILFIDTFAEVSEPTGAAKLPEEKGSKTSPILGFVPRNGERIAWKSFHQAQPFYTESQGSILLQSERYRFGEIRGLPSWLGALPLLMEDRVLAEVCRRYFAEAHGNGELALARLIQDESPAVRTLGLRLWGDLGRFDVPIAVVAERRQGEEAIRHVLNQYFEEVMRRDEETIQRFAEAIQFVKDTQAQKN